MLPCLTSKSTKCTQWIDVETPREKFIDGAELVPTHQPKNKSLLGGMLFEPNHLRPGHGFAFASDKLVNLSKNKATGRIKAPTKLVRELNEIEGRLANMHKADRPVPITILKNTCNISIIIREREQ